MIDAQIALQNFPVTVNFTSDELNTPSDCKINDEEFIGCK